MTARDILHQWSDEAILKIEAHAESIGGDNPEIIDALEKVRDPKGWDGVRAPDAEHEQVFRLQALADLMEKVDEIRSRPSEAAKDSKKK
jgi:hypothetical protein